MKSRSTLVAIAALFGAFASSAAASPDTTPGRIWVLTDLSYELPSSSSVSFEVGFGLYGLGGGVNLYTNSAKDGLMASLRVGDFGVGYAANAELNLVGKFSRAVSWRIGAGAEYISFNLGTTNVPLFGENVPLNLSGHGFIPVFEASIGFRL